MERLYFLDLMNLNGIFSSEFGNAIVFIFGFIIFIALICITTNNIDNYKSKKVNSKGKLISTKKTVRNLIIIDLVFVITYILFFVFVY